MARATKKPTKRPAAKKATKAAAKKPPAKKPPAKKSPAKKSPAKKPPAKKSPAKKPPANKPEKQPTQVALPDAVRQALAIAANEVLFESLEMIADDPQGFLEDGSLGATYQSFIGATTFPDPQVETWLGDLAAWAPATGDPAWQRLGVALERASQDIARALIHGATGVGEVPATVAAHAAGFTKVTAALGRAIADGFFDEEDLQALLAL